MSLYLDVKYLNLLSSQLERFKKKSNTLWSCRCTICGDSQKKKTKTRGYFFRKKDSLFYYCHNCGASMSLGNLIKFLNKALYDQYVLERYASGENGRKTHNKPDFTEIKPKKLIKLKLNLPNILDLSEKHIAYQYLINRKIPKEFFELFYYVEDFPSWGQKITEGKLKNKYKSETTDPRLIIPFLDRNKNLIAVQGRSLLQSKLRYVTIKFDEDSPKIFGLDRWSPFKKTYVTEGPLDSLFVPNAIAMAGSSVDISSLIENKKDITMIFDNENKNREICRLMEAKIKNDYSICIWPETNKENDINDMILSGRTKESILEEIESNTYHGLGALLTLNQWRKC